MRAIRSYIGANSGPLTERQHVFYERREDITTYLRVHAIPGRHGLLRLQPGGERDDLPEQRRHRAASRSTARPTRSPPATIAWETVDGPQGGLSIVHAITHRHPRLELDVSYYLDKQNPSGGSETQCTGDGSAYGSSGPWITQGIPNTDPRSTPFYRLTSTRTLFFENPGAADGPKRATEVAEPLQVAVAPHG